MRTAIVALSLILTVKGACFIESGTTTGVDEGVIFSNKAELEAIGTGNVAFHSFTSCTSISTGDLLGT